MTMQTLRGIADNLELFLDCNRACTANPDLELLELMSIDARNSKRDSADKNRYVLSLIKMCDAVGLRNCLTALSPTTDKLAERDLGTSGELFKQTVPNESSATTTGPNADATPDVEGKKDGRGGRGGGGGGHKHSGTARIGDGWVVRACVIICIVGWFGFVTLL